VPELPEVETVRKGLERHVVGRTVSAVQVLHPVRCGGTWPAPPTSPRLSAGGPSRPPAGAASTCGCPWPNMERARMRWRRTPSWPTGDERAVPHLRSRGAALASCPGPVHVHRFRSGPTVQRPADVRSPGLATGGAVLPGLIAHIAPDPTGARLRCGHVHRQAPRPAHRHQAGLLDQSLVSGIGNIYADEALWRARLHWARNTGTVTRPEAVRVLDAVRGVLGDALDAGGTSFDQQYVNVNGESGYFGRSLAVYGRAGQPCGRCGTPVRRDPFMNRSAYSLPALPAPPAGPHPAAVTCGIAQLDRIPHGWDP